MTYKGFDVFPNDIAFLNSINLTIKHKRVILGKPYQNQMYLYNQSDRYQFNVTLQYNTYEDYTRIRRWFRHLKGKGTKFWFPSVSNDFKLIAPVAAGNNQILIENPLYDYFYKRKKMYIYLPELDWATKVTAMSPAGFTGTEDGIRVAKLTLADPFPYTINNLKECPYITELFLGTMNTDSITFNFYDLVRGEAQFGFEELTTAHYEKLAI